jgi:hypothetical protein
MSQKKRIEPGQGVAVPFTEAEKRLMERVVLADEYANRLRPAGKDDGYSGEFTLEDIDDLLGFIAAEANQTRSGKLQDALDELYERLQGLLDEYDDGNERRMEL